MLLFPLTSELQTYDTRNRIVLHQVALCRARQDSGDEMKYWERLRDVLVLYGRQGTSSDESDNEDGLTVYRVRTLPWRKDIRDYLEFIDAHWYDGKTYSNRGARPRLRTRRRYIESKRGPVLKLPLEFYDKGWIRIDGDEQVNVLAEASTSRFDWPSN